MADACVETAWLFRSWTVMSKVKRWLPGNLLMSAGTVKVTFPVLSVVPVALADHAAERTVRIVSHQSKSEKL